MEVDAKVEGVGEGIDESLYSRQLYAIGKDAMLKMQRSSVLIIGLSGLEAQIASGLAHGKIVPALVTTTSVVCGLVCLELYKIFQEKKLDDYKNGFVNLALPFFDFATPVPTPKYNMKGKEFSMWDKISFNGDLTLQEMLDNLNKEHNLEIDMITCVVKMLYNTFILPPQKQQERTKMKISEIAEKLAGIDLSEKKQVELVCIDADDECDVPSITVIF